MNNKLVSLDGTGLKWTEYNGDIILEAAIASHLPPAKLAMIQPTKGHWVIKDSPTGALYGDLPLAKKDAEQLVSNDLRQLSDSMATYIFNGGDSVGGYPIGALNIARIMLSNKLTKALGLPTAKVNIHISAFLPSARLSHASRIMDQKNNYTLPALEAITISASLGGSKLELRATSFESLTDAVNSIRRLVIDSYIPAATTSNIHCNSLMPRGNYARSN